MSELDKLEAYLKESGVNYKRVDKETGEFWQNRHQIFVFTQDGTRLWDAICHYGSYGYVEGLLEVMNCSVVLPEDGGDSVCGWLTAEDVIKRWEDSAEYKKYYARKAE